MKPLLIRHRLTAVLMAPMVLLSSGADAASGRYQMTPIEGGFMRLDTETGAVSICKAQAGKVSCTPAEDQVPATSGQASAALKKENARLRAELERLERHFGLGPNTADPSKPNDLAPPTAPSKPLKIPQTEDVDQLFNYIEGMLKKFRERIERLEKEAERETTPL